MDAITVAQPFRAAKAVVEFLRTRGASFFHELAAACDLDDAQLRSAIGDLVAAGVVASDGFAGLRAILSNDSTAAKAGRHRHQAAGRWSALAPTSLTRESALDEYAWSLLRRYGVVCRRVIAREANAAPWRDLTRVYRRLEARGEIRGGRFVAGLSGEQFALPDAVERLREVRRSAPDGLDYAP